MFIYQVGLYLKGGGDLYPEEYLRWQTEKLILRGGGGFYNWGILYDVIQLHLFRSFIAAVRLFSKTESV